MKFKKNFYWGAATSAEQSEGQGITKKGDTYWDVFYQRKPDLFHNGIGPSVTNDKMKHYKEDLKIFKEIGFNSLRDSFSWSRLFPDGEELNQEAVQYYHDFLSKAKSLGITMFMCLSHFDWPAWILEKGGLENKYWINKYLEYAKFVFTEYKDEVSFFSTFNEPIVCVTCSYLNKCHWPCEVNSKKAIQVGYNITLAHALAVNYFQSNITNISKSKIGVIVNITPAIAKDDITATKADKEAARLFDIFHNYAILDGMALGKFPNELIKILKRKDLLPDFTPNEILIIKKVKIDYLGLNFYAPQRVVAPSQKELDDNKTNIMAQIATPYHYSKARYNVFRGWEIRPETLFDIAKIIKTRYNNIPFYVSENGMGVSNEEKYRNKDGYIEDDYRIAFIQEHLLQVHKAIQELDVNCFGYHLWTPIDCWSWLNGYKNRYGFIELNLETQKRIIKKSGYWFKEMTLENEIKTPFKKIEECINFKKD